MHLKVSCAECYRYLYFAAKAEIENEEKKQMAGKPLDNKPGWGVMFEQRVAADSKQPTLRGGIHIEGLGEVVIVGWERYSKNGVKYWSLKQDTQANNGGDKEPF